MSESWMDRIIYPLVTRRLDDKAIANYPALVEKQETLSASSSFPVIDAKATGVLAHVSMMIAGLGLVAPLVANSGAELGMIITEMAAYLLIAMGCLRCLSIFAGYEISNGDIERKFARELIIRRELYVLCHRASLILTIIVFVLLPIQFFWDPPK